MDVFPDTLTQNDLRLRPLTNADLPEIAAQLNDDRVAYWLAAIAPPFDTQDAQELLHHSQHPGEHLRVIEHDGDVVGGLCIGASLWYWLKPTHWGRGLMSRALKLAIAAHYARPAPPLVATCHKDNVASQALLARLGFAASPLERRMFFWARQCAEPCCDYVMAPELWHLLYPPEILAATATLRPALQGDAVTLGQMLPAHTGGPWSSPDTLLEFIETHRFRGGPDGLFVILDEHRRSIGVALITANNPNLIFLSDQDRARHHSAVLAALSAHMSAIP